MVCVAHCPVPVWQIPATTTISNNNKIRIVPFSSFRLSIVPKEESIPPKPASADSRQKAEYFLSALKYFSAVVLTVPGRLPFLPLFRLWKFYPACGRLAHHQPIYAGTENIFPSHIQNIYGKNARYRHTSKQIRKPVNEKLLHLHFLSDQTHCLINNQYYNDCRHGRVGIYHTCMTDTGQILKSSSLSF